MSSQDEVDRIYDGEIERETGEVGVEDCGFTLDQVAEIGDEVLKAEQMLRTARALVRDMAENGEFSYSLPVLEEKVGKIENPNQIISLLEMALRYLLAASEATQEAAGLCKQAYDKIDPEWDREELRKAIEIQEQSKVKLKKEEDFVDACENTYKEANTLYEKVYKKLYEMIEENHNLGEEGADGSHQQELGKLKNPEELKQNNRDNLFQLLGEYRSWKETHTNATHAEAGKRVAD